MMVANPAEAEWWLGVVGYYRLSAYWYLYRVRHQTAGGPPVVGDDFVPGTSFKQITALYTFDCRFKLLVLGCARSRSSGSGREKSSSSTTTPARTEPRCLCGW